MPASLRERALCLLLCCAFEQRAELVKGAAAFGRWKLLEPLEQGCCSGDVLAHAGEVWGTPTILKDPPVYIAGGGAHIHPPCGNRSRAQARLALALAGVALP
jgi:hypothetical protein